MKVYVAASSKELGRAQKWIKRLQGAGITVTYDWTKPVSEFGTMGQTLTREQKVEYAANDLVGIEKADYCWLLTPAKASIGAWLETGYSLGRTLHDPENHLLVASPPASALTLFGELDAFSQFETDELAFDFLIHKHHG